MLQGLLKSKFYIKCKSLLKMSKTRLEMLKKKKSSVVRFLKNDLVELLRNDLDHNAYCRAEGLLVEQKMIACYNFIEQFCECISCNLSAMNKQRECPEECREAVQSLIYAAARIAEFPELRDFRTLFTERYGTPNESLVNKEFAERLRPKQATKEMKLQLLHDIAEEFNIDWNSKSLEQKLFKPPQEDQNRHCTKSKDDIVLKGDCQGDDEDGNRRKKNKNDMKKASPEAGNKVPMQKLASHGRRNSINEGYNLPCSSEEEVNSRHRRSSSDLDSLQATSSSVGSVSEDEADSKKPFYYRFIPPPYFKRKAVKEALKIEEHPKATGNVVADDSVIESKPKPKSVRRRKLKQPPGQEFFGSVEGPLKPPPDREKCVSIETDGTTKANSIAEKEAEAKKGSRISEADDRDVRDEEEKTIDGLLMHYSNDTGKSWRTSDDSSVGSKRRNPKSEELALPPVGEAHQAEEAGSKKGAARHNRAVSLQLEAGHVHPKLPDYEDLAARFAALKGDR